VPQHIRIHLTCFPLSPTLTWLLLTKCLAGFLPSADRVLALEVRLKAEADKLGAAAHSHPFDIPLPVAHPSALPLTECLACLLLPAV
jgi:hypothetical protein